MKKQYLLIASVSAVTGFSACTVQVTKAPLPASAPAVALSRVIAAPRALVDSPRAQLTAARESNELPKENPKKSEQHAPAKATKREVAVAAVAVVVKEQEPEIAPLPEPSLCETFQTRSPEDGSVVENDACPGFAAEQKKDQDAKTPNGLALGWSHSNAASPSKNRNAPAVSSFLIAALVPAAELPTPGMRSPSLNPYISSDTSITLSGDCKVGTQVLLSGASSQVAPCSETGTYSFTVTGNGGGVLDFALAQTNRAGKRSASRRFVWVQDQTVAPTPSVTWPTSGDYYSNGDEVTVSGACKNGTIVTLAGDVRPSDVTTPVGHLSRRCMHSSYSFTIRKTLDATYLFGISQDSSAQVQVRWVRSSNPPAPPGVRAPTGNSRWSNGSSFRIEGACTNGLLVHLEGPVTAEEVLFPQGSLSAVCVDSSYLFVIAKRRDGHYKFMMRQKNRHLDSGSVEIEWLRDTSAPDTAWVSEPNSTNLTTEATFAFVSSESDNTFECSLDSADFTACASPVILSGLTNASHTFAVRAMDMAGNLDPTPVSASWSQDGHKTVALYHFDSPDAMADSSLYGRMDRNSLTDASTATTKSSSAKFSEARKFTASSSQMAYAVDRSTQQTTRQAMTIDFWMAFPSSLANNEDYVVVSKTGAAGDYGWILKMRRLGSKVHMVFVGSLDGASYAHETKSHGCSWDTASFHHYAVTWNKGAAQFFCDGVAQGGGKIGTAGSASLHGSPASLRVGGQADMSSDLYLNAIIDELRISQVPRWISNFTPAGVAYSAD